MVIYKITNKINGKCYIGRTKRKLIYRIAEHKRNAKKKSIKYPIYNAIRKYGINNFEYSIIDTAKNEKDLLEKEQTYIDKFGDYNIGSSKDGGDNYINNPRRKEIMESLKGSKKRIESAKKRWNKDERDRQSNVAKKQMTKEKSKAMKQGLRNKMKDPIFRRNLIEKQRETGAYSPEVIKKRSQSRAREWIIITPNNNKIVIKNMSNYCKENNLSCGAMSMVASNKRNHHKGYKVEKWH